MAHHTNGNRGGVEMDDPYAELAPEYEQDAALAGHYDFNLEDELMYELGDQAGNASARLELDAPSLAMDVEDLPNMHLGGRHAAAAAPSQATGDDPFAVLAAMADRYRVNSPAEGWTDAAASRSDPPFEAPARQASRAAAPEIETVDVREATQYAAFDLDLPEVFEDEPAERSVVADFDADFDDLLNQMAGQGPAQPSRYDDGYRPAASAPGAAFAAPRQLAYADKVHIEAAPRRRDEMADELAENRMRAVADDFDLDGDGFEDEMAFAGYEQVKPKPQRRLWMGAALGGLAVAAAVGAYAAGMFGGALSGAPALIAADQNPIKVRPANPGGAVIANQDSSVYDAVAGKARPALDQKKLVNGKETPIELAEELPENGDDDVALADEPKSEERIEQIAQAEPAEPAKVAVAPRKVQTMVVKSDGSIAPAAKKPVKKQQAASPEAVAEAAERKPANVAAETTASIPAASGAWAVQIASEGSEQAAKTALKRLSGKYSAVIGDKGAAIVKTDIPGTGIRWRVRIMSDSRAEAAGLCKSLKAKGGSCFVSKT